MFGRRWVMSLLVLTPVVTVCVAVVAAVVVATLTAFAVLVRLIPQQFTVAVRQRQDGASLS